MSLRRKSGRNKGGLRSPRKVEPPVRRTFLIVPVEISRLPSTRTASTRLRAPSRSSSWARATPGPAASARTTKTARVRALSRRGDLTRRRLVVPMHGGPMLDGAGEIVEQNEDDEAADEDEPHALVGEREPLGRRASAHRLDEGEEQVPAVEHGQGQEVEGHDGEADHREDVDEIPRPALGVGAGDLD